MSATTDAESFLRAVISRCAAEPPDAFGLDDDLTRAAGVDSLVQLQMVAAFEQEFGVRVPDAEIEGLRTIRDFLDRVRPSG